MTFSNVPTLRTYLRETSLTQHLQTEAAFLPTGQFDSEAAYFVFLTALLEVHSAMGRAAAAARQDQADMVEEDRRIAALTSDLRIGQPRVIHAPKRMDCDYGWGVGYVLNGSTLGAATLLKRPDALAPDWPRSYLQLGRDYAQSGRLKRFFARLNAEPRDKGHIERGASDTFSMISTFSPKGPRHECSAI